MVQGYNNNKNEKQESLSIPLVPYIILVLYNLLNNSLRWVLILSPFHR